MILSRKSKEKENLQKSTYTLIDFSSFLHESNKNPVDIFIFIYLPWSNKVKKKTKSTFIIFAVPVYT